MTNLYTLTEQQLLSLIEDRLYLTALEAGGVDNWNYYGEAIRDYEKELDVLNLEEAAYEILKQYAKNN